MDALIQTLKRRGGTLMVATLKREEQAITVIEHLGLFPYMSAVVGSDDEGQRTKKDTIDMAMRLSGAADYTASLMIGDSEFDAIGAERAGVDFCAATYGFGLTPEPVSYTHLDVYKRQVFSGTKAARGSPCKLRQSSSARAHCQTTAL